MYQTSFAQIGHAPAKFFVKIFAFFAKMFPSFAYRFTHKDNRYARYFLMGAKKEIALINKLLVEDKPISKLQQHLWSHDTKVEALSQNPHAKIFVENIRLEDEFDAAMKHTDISIRILACSQRSYSPSQQRVEKILQEDTQCVPALVNNHIGCFKVEILNKLSTEQQMHWINLATNGSALPSEEQVGWVLDQSKNLREKQVGWVLGQSWNNRIELFINKFYSKVPLKAEYLVLLFDQYPTAFKKWQERQKAAILCQHLLKFFIINNYEENLRIIEEKCFQESNAEAALHLVITTKREDFPDAIRVILAHNAATANLLNCLTENSLNYKQVLRQVINNRKEIGLLSKAQVDSCDDEMFRLYWKNKAMFNLINNTELNNIKDENLQQTLKNILEDNALKYWFNTNHFNNETLSIFKKQNPSANVLAWLAVNKHWSWLIAYTFGNDINDGYRHFTHTANSFVFKQEPRRLPFAVFCILVDRQEKLFLKTYFLKHRITEQEREYLLCSKLSDMAVSLR